MIQMKFCLKVIFVCYYLGNASEGEPEVNVTMLNELMLMGIPELAAKHALVNTGNSSSEVAISWYFEHMTDPSLTQPLAKIKKMEGDSKYTEENVAIVMEFGFSREQAIYGLSNTVKELVKNRIIIVKEQLTISLVILWKM